MSSLFSLKLERMQYFITLGGGDPSLIWCRLPRGAAIALGVSLPEAWQTLRYRQQLRQKQFMKGLT